MINDHLTGLYLRELERRAKSLAHPQQRHFYSQLHEHMLSMRDELNKAAKKSVPYDPECLQLARHYVTSGTDIDVDHLATLIQNTVDSWLSDAPLIEEAK
jgi:hypothetical protein